MTADRLAGPTSVGTSSLAPRSPPKGYRPTGETPVTTVLIRRHLGDVMPLATLGFIAAIIGGVF